MNSTLAALFWSTLASKDGENNTPSSSILEAVSYLSKYNPPPITQLCSTDISRVITSP